MDVNLPTSNDSKVLVECHDPHNLFDSIQPLLAERLPLRDLNWKSPSRPLRSINSLHVDLVRGKSRGAGETEDGSKVQRRHQIPGLVKSPYVRIYLLRCDERETYKATERKAVRDWVKSVSASSEGGYDACEWLILHVVLPDTAAASEPRVSSKRSSDGPSDSTDSIPGKSKWPGGRGSSTLLEKLQADFNSSSKGGLDRVAQIRLAKDTKQGPAPTAQSKSEDRISWHDVVEKLKTSVLTAFDTRVLQYEEDIHERDGQRNLPGWNFCTFFILKEGLAKGFEEVGLYEDALSVYEELAYNLDLVIREQSAGDGNGHGGSLSLSTGDVHEQASQLLKSSEKPPTNGKTDGSKGSKTLSFQLPANEYVVDSASKPYRDLILSNNISVFDFLVYIFSRELALLLRAARPHSSTKSQSNEDFLLLANVCNRASEFISNGSRTMREDLIHGFGQTASPTEEPTQPYLPVIDNMVSSWIYRVCLQVLSQTASSALAIPASGITGSESNGDLSPNPTPVPERSASPRLQTNPRRLSSIRSMSGQSGMNGSEKPAPTKTGAEELASARAELFLVARRLLQKIGSQRSWQVGWNSLEMSLAEGIDSNNDMDDVSLDDDNPPSGSFTLIGLEPLQLKLAASSQEHFTEVFEALTEQAYRHFVAGNKLKSAEGMVADIALQKYRDEDYQTAASLFRRLSAFYASGSWPTLSGELSNLYANCLKKMGDVDEYVDIQIKLLTSWAHSRKSASSAARMGRPAIGHLDELLEVSSNLTRHIVIPLEQMFSISEVPTQILRHDENDGFFINLRLCCLLEEAVTITEGMTMTLKIATDLYAPAILLTSKKSVVVKAMPTTVALNSNVTTSGNYQVDELSFRLGNLEFVHSFRTNEENGVATAASPNDAETQPSIVLFPAAQALDVIVGAEKQIKLGEQQRMEVDIDSGWNDILEGTIHIRPATAGMRLRINEARVTGDDEHNIKIVDEEGSQVIRFGPCGPNSRVPFILPYTLENPDFVQLEARLEVKYQTSHGSFTLLKNVSLNSTLPVSVNVQDIFRSDALLSRFTIGSATLVPLQLLDCQVQGNSRFNVKCGMKGPITMEVSPKQPASLLYKITPASHGHQASQDRPLLLQAEYACIDELALQTLEDKFRTDVLVSEISNLKGLLLPYFLEVFRSQWTANDLEAISMLRVITPWPFLDFGWDAVLTSLDKESKSKAKSWLTAWHAHNTAIPLLRTDLGSNFNRRITITVEVPTPSVVVTASLPLTQQTGRSSMPTAVGEPQGAELRISFTRQWAGSPGTDQESPIEMSYDIISNVDSWLVGGRKRGNFVSQPGQETRFPLMLLPQRPGHLLLPSVEIKCFKIEEQDREETLSRNRMEIPCELDYRSHAKAVLVIPDLSETTVAMDGDGIGRNEWLMGSKRRIEVL